MRWGDSRAGVLLTRIGLSLLMCSTLGCGATARVAVGPTVDTRGNAGVDAKLVLGFGPGVGVHIMPTATFGGGSGDGGAPLFVSGAGLEVRGGDREGAIRGNLLYSSRRYFHDEADKQLHGAGLAIGAVYAPFSKGSSGAFGLPGSVRQIAIGGDIQAEVLGGDGARGVFSFPLVIEAFLGSY